MSVTIKDIARKAGVSHTTVSRSLNGNSSIPERTAATIRDLAMEMGYLPSAAARGLKTNRSQVLGVIVSRIDNPYFGDIVQGIEDTLKNTGYSIFVASTNFDQSHEKEIIQAFGEHRVDGVILGSISFNKSHTELLSSYKIPVVVINNQSPRDNQLSIAHDDVFGARQLTRHLLDLGHRGICYIGNSRARRINRDRARGFELEMKEAGLSITEDAIINVEGSEIEDGVLGMQRVLANPQLPTAVFCFNDLMAIGALKVLQERSIRVPEQISIAGFDNISYSAYTIPSLTTFNQPKRLIGAEAAKMLLELITQAQNGNGHHKPPIRLIRGNLLIRNSTGPAPERTYHEQH